jgi:hypothetical protein
MQQYAFTVPNAQTLLLTNQRQPTFHPPAQPTKLPHVGCVPPPTFLPSFSCERRSAASDDCEEDLSEHGCGGHDGEWQEAAGAVFGEWERAASQEHGLSSRRAGLRAPHASTRAQQPVGTSGVMELCPAPRVGGAVGM